MQAQETMIKSLDTFAEVFLSKSTFVGGEVPSIADFSVAGPILHLRTINKFDDVVPEVSRRFQIVLFDSHTPQHFFKLQRTGRQSKSGPQHLMLQHLAMARP